MLSYKTPSLLFYVFVIFDNARINSKKFTEKIGPLLRSTAAVFVSFPCINNSDFRPLLLLSPFHSVVVFSLL